MYRRYGRKSYACVLKDFLKVKSCHLQEKGAADAPKDKFCEPYLRPTIPKRLEDVLLE